MEILLFCPYGPRLERETVAAINAIQCDRGLEIQWGTDNPYGGHDPRNILHQYQQAWKIVREEGKDALFTVEADIIPPPDALMKLLKVEADIVYGVYMFRRYIPMLNIIRPNIHRQWPRLFGQVLECDGLGYGCTLIHRNVIEAIDLRTTGDGGDSDGCLAKDAKAKGFIQKTDTSVLCGHIRQKGTVLWPTRTGHREVWQ